MKRYKSIKSDSGSKSGKSRPSSKTLSKKGNKTMTHEMNLHDSPFDMIKSGKKIYELRLYDEKRRNIKVGDEILFTRSRGGDDSMRCLVVGLHLFDSFEELYSSLPLLKCGYTEEDIHTAHYSDMDIYYSKERQAMYGVVAIEIRLL